MGMVYAVMGLALLQYLAFGIAVGAARGRYGVKAPATTGNEVFERYYRVQMNTLEQLALFLPAIFLAAPVLGDAIANNKAVFPNWPLIIGLAAAIAGW